MFSMDSSHGEMPGLICDDMHSGKFGRLLFLYIMMAALQSGHGQNEQAVHSEICQWDTFHANCSQGKVIFIDSAYYGRIRNSRCAQLNNEQPCFIDVQLYVERQCAGRRLCSIVLPNKDMDQMPNTCSKQLKPYLEVNYHCIEVYSAGDQSCVANRSLTIGTSSGYLANIITDETNKGSSPCPWKIELLPEQTVHLTLLDFGAYRNSTSPDRGTICHIYATVKDSFASVDGSGSFVCGGEARETQLLTYVAKEIQISMKKLNDRTTDPIYFLIKYEVIGCPAFSTPVGASVETISSGFRVSCHDPDLGTWEVRCVDGKWEPSTADKNCAVANLSPTPDAGLDSGFQQGILIVVVIAIAIIISAIIIVVGIFFLHRRKNEGLLDSPVLSKHGVALYPTPLLGKRYLVPGGPDRSMGDLERDYATTLQMRQMVLPSAVMQPECHPAPGDMWMCPVHGTRTAGIATGNGTLSRRFKTFQPQMEHIYELPGFELKEIPHSCDSGKIPPESPFYHEFDPSLPDEPRENAPELEPSLSVAPETVSPK